MNGTEREVELMMYGAYVVDWMKNHEGMPASFDEFVNNEGDDDEYMLYLMDKIIGNVN